jgi:hypothetical protein
MIDKNLHQRINMKFCVNFGTSETLALLTLAYGGCAVKESSVLNGMCGSRNGEKLCKRTQEVGSQKLKGKVQI